MARDEVARVVIRRMSHFEAPLLIEFVRIAVRIRSLNHTRRTSRVVLPIFTRAGAGEGVGAFAACIGVPDGIVRKHVAMSVGPVVWSGACVVGVTVAWSGHASAYGYRVVPAPAGVMSGAATWYAHGDGGG